MCIPVIHDAKIVKICKSKAIRSLKYPKRAARSQSTPEQWNKIAPCGVQDIR